MKNAKFIAVSGTILLAAAVAAAQSLGDYARAVRNNKPETSSPSRHFDNDNLPTQNGLSVVGPPPDSDAKSPASPADAPKAAPDAWKEKLDKQKEKVASLSHDLEAAQREDRVRASEVWANPLVRLRSPAQWDDQTAKLKADIDAKQKALDAARQELDTLQQEANTADANQKQKDASAINDKDKNKDKNKDQDTDSKYSQSKDSQNKDNQSKDSQSKDNTN